MNHARNYLILAALFAVNAILFAITLFAPDRQAFNAAPVPPDTITLEMIVGQDTCYTSVPRKTVQHDAKTVRVIRFRCATRGEK